MHTKRVAYILVTLATAGALVSCATTGIQLSRRIPIPRSEVVGEEVAACASGYVVNDTVVVNLLVVNRGAGSIRLNPVEVAATGITSEGLTVVRVWEPEAFTAAHSPGSRYPTAMRLPATEPTESKTPDTLAEMLERQSDQSGLPLLRPIAIPPGHYVLGSLVLERIDAEEYRLSLPYIDGELRLVPEAASVEPSSG